jgi:glutaminyl-peptide cyclotransferase
VDVRGIVIVGTAALLAGGCGGASAAPPPSAATPAPPAGAGVSARDVKPVAAAPARFDAARAWSLIKLQLEYGQRPAGSPQLRRLAGRLKARMTRGRYEAIPGEPRLRNVVGSLPGRKPGIVIGAHYDTLVKPKGFVGANNGAAGSAIVVQLSRDLAHVPRPANARAVTFVLFDGEEPAAGLPEDDPNFATDGLRGSRAYVAAHPDQTSQMILLDYVGNKGLQLPREGTSTAGLWSELRDAASAAGVASFFPDTTGVSIIDDHTPFLNAGVPAVDLIDWSYPGHTLQDGLDMLSERSVDAVGETVLELVRRLEAQ